MFNCEKPKNENCAYFDQGEVPVLVQARSPPPPPPPRQQIKITISGNEQCEVPVLVPLS